MVWMNLANCYQFDREFIFARTRDAFQHMRIVSKPSKMCLSQSPTVPLPRLLHFAKGEITDAKTRKQCELSLPLSRFEIVQYFKALGVLRSTNMAAQCRLFHRIGRIPLRGLCIKCVGIAVGCLNIDGFSAIARFIAGRTAWTSGFVR